MKVYEREVTRTVRFIEIDGEEFHVSEVLEALDVLSDADGAFTRAILGSQRMADIFEKRKVAFRNVRGSYGKDENFQEFYTEVEELVYV